jgi:hypothetical protein
MRNLFCFLLEEIMNRSFWKPKMLLSIFVLWLMATGSVTPLLRAAPTATLLATEGLAYKIILTGNTYEVYLRPDTTPNAPNLTLTAQVTLKVPHGVDLDRFVISDLKSAVAGTIWSASSRIDAPTEAPGFARLATKPFVHQSWER